MKKRIIYLDYLKIIAGIFVVLIHVCSQYWEYLPLNSIDFKVLTCLDSICRCCVPIYFMVSGALFLNDEKSFTIKEILKKYALKMLLVFIFWNIIYSILSILIIKGSSINLESIITIFKSTLLGNGIYHLTFLVTIIGFYLCVPILKLITKKENKKLLQYLIIILFIFTSVNLLTKSLIDIRISYPLVFSSFILYFILGYYLNTFEIDKRRRIIIYIVGLISLFLTMILTINYSSSINKASELFFKYLSPNVVLYSTSVFLLFKNKKNLKENKIISTMANLYFGIYLVHGLVLGFYLKLGLFNLNLPKYLLVIVLFVIIYLTSLLVSFIISKIPVIKKIILVK